MSAGATTSRLWPVLAIWTVVVLGTLALEGVARRRASEPLLVNVGAGDQYAVAGDDAVDAGTRGAGGDGRVRLRAIKLALDRGERTAEVELRALVAARPGYTPARITLADLLKDRGGFEEALVVLRSAQATGGNDERAAAHIAQGRVLLRAGRSAQAGRSFDEAINLAPSSLSVRAGIARAWLGISGAEAGRQAVAVVERAVLMAPDVAELQTLVGQARERAGDAAGAAVAFDRALALDPEDAYARRRACRLALERHDHAMAAGHVERLLAAHPDRPEHLFLSGLVAARAGRRDEALRQYQAAIEKADGVYPEAHFNIGLLHRTAGDIPAAVAAYRQAIAARPAYREALNNLGLALRAASQPTEAEAALRQAIGVDGRYATAWLNLGELLAGTDRPGPAAEAFRRALEARPGDDRAALGLAAALATAGRREEAIATLRALVQRQPRSVAAWTRLGEQLTDVAQLDEARRALGRALAIDQDGAATWRALATLEARAGRLPEAERAYRELLDRLPADRPARLALGALLARAGDSAACVAAARAVLAQQPEDRDAAALLLRCTRSAAPDQTRSL